MKIFTYLFLITFVTTLVNGSEYSTPQRPRILPRTIVYPYFKFQGHVFKKKTQKPNIFKRNPTAGTLAKSVHNNNIEKIKAILDKNPSLINKKTIHKQRTALFYVQSKEVIELLLNYNPDVTITDKTGRKALDSITIPHLKKALSKRLTQNNNIIPLCVICQEKPCTKKLHFTCNDMTVCKDDEKVFLEKCSACPLCRQDRKKISLTQRHRIINHQNAIKDEYERSLNEQALQELFENDASSESEEWFW